MFRVTDPMVKVKDQIMYFLVKRISPCIVGHSNLKLCRFIKVRKRAKIRK